MQSEQTDATTTGPKKYSRFDLLGAIVPQISCRLFDFLSGLLEVQIVHHLSETAHDVISRLARISTQMHPYMDRHRHGRRQFLHACHPSTTLTRTRTHACTNNDHTWLDMFQQQSTKCNGQIEELPQPMHIRTLAGQNKATQDLKCEGPIKGRAVTAEEPGRGKATRPTWLASSASTPAHAPP